jgi:hypothetical protein
VNRVSAAWLRDPRAPISAFKTGADDQEDPAGMVYSKGFQDFVNEAIREVAFRDPINQTPSLYQSMKGLGSPTE